MDFFLKNSQRYGIMHFSVVQLDQLWCIVFWCTVAYVEKKKDETLRSRCMSMIREQKNLKEVLKVNDKWNNFILTGFQDMGHVPAENDLVYLEEIHFWGTPFDASPLCVCRRY